MIIIYIIFLLLLIYLSNKNEEFINYKNYDYSNKLTIDNIVNLKKGQKIMTEMLKEFDSVCRQNNLKYWCTSGTLIGVMRHKGWIPHDGDIDVAMIDSDWEKFKEIYKNIKNNNYWIQDSKTDKKCKFLHGKIRHKHGCYLTNNKFNPWRGLSLDIFRYKLSEDKKKLISLSTFKDLRNYDYDFIFPLKNKYFENIKIYVPNKLEEYSKLNWNNYPPKLLDLDKRYPHEGIISFNKKCFDNYKSYVSE